MLMDLVFVLKWVKSVFLLYIFHLSDVEPIAAVGQKLELFD